VADRQQRQRLRLPDGGRGRGQGGGIPADPHTAISVGDGTFITTSPQGIIQGGGNWLDSDHYAGWAPPGLAEGGYFPGHDGRIVEIGEGPEEIAAPTDMLRQIVREESGHNFTFEKGAIAVARDGTVTVDPSRIRVDPILGALRQSGKAGV
jgi:hypothetical protein